METYLLMLVASVLVFSMLIYSQVLRAAGRVRLMELNLNMYCTFTTMLSDPMLYRPN